MPTPSPCGCKGSIQQRWQSTGPWACAPRRSSAACGTAALLRRSGWKPWPADCAQHRPRTEQRPAQGPRPWCCRPRTIRQRARPAPAWHSWMPCTGPADPRQGPAAPFPAEAPPFAGTAARHAAAGIFSAASQLDWPKRLSALSSSNSAASGPSLSFLPPTAAPAAITGSVWNSRVSPHRTVIGKISPSWKIDEKRSIKCCIITSCCNLMAHLPVFITAQAHPPCPAPTAPRRTPPPPACRTRSPARQW